MRLPAIVLAAALVLPALAPAATPFSNDASDLWFNPAESGWGVNIAQQGDVAFLTLYTYGADGKATWFVASSMHAEKSGTTVTYTGDLFASTGPAFNAPTFDSNAVVRTQVGTASFQVAHGTQGTLTYTVNGTTVTKAVIRQTWRENNASGNYIGYLGSSCATSTSGAEESMTFSIVQTYPSFAMTATGASGVSCGYNGTYSQDGRLGHVEGTVACTNNKSGTFVMDSTEASPDAFMTRLSTRVGSCAITGRLAGIRRN
jgi:hypothetical protein